MLGMVVGNPLGKVVGMAGSAGIAGTAATLASVVARAAPPSPFGAAFAPPAVVAAPSGAAVWTAGVGTVAAGVAAGGT